MWYGHRDMTIVASGLRSSTRGTGKGGTSGEIGVTSTSGGTTDGKVPKRLRNPVYNRRSGIANRLTDVRREVNDELAVDDEVIVGLLQVQSEHL